MKTNSLYHMKKTLIAANWKSNKTKNEARNWIFEVSRQEFPDNLEIVILPPFTLLDFLDSFIKANNLKFKLGAQDISPFGLGAYTGEVNASQVKEFASYVLIGHSERRKNFSESDEQINQKIQQAESLDLIPIVCVSDVSQLEDLKSEKEMVIAYEPPGAISTSGPGAKAEDPDSVLEFVRKIKEKNPARVIYGGSVGADNVKDYTGLDNIEGVLVGGKSLDAESFINLVNNAT
ncbi:MAG: triosephosphate isomerase [uncultured bacterium]|nr:MAG: triosephosphate isomerase [uncultured bacterium]